MQYRCNLAACLVGLTISSLKAFCFEIVIQDMGKRCVD